MRRRIAVSLFGLSVIAIVITNAYELAVGTSRMLTEQGSLIFTAVIAVLAVLQLVYASAMKKRAVLA